jgi:itaconyl-CoA hydratase
MNAHPAEFPLWSRGNYFENFEVGQTFDHHWGRTVHQYDSVLFNSLTLSYAPVYLNNEFAKDRIGTGCEINPYFIFLLVLGMSVEDTSEGVDGAEGAFLGVKEVQFLQPVTDGDTITAHTSVVATRVSGSRPNSGIVTWRTTGRNQHGQNVLQFERTNLVSRRPLEASQNDSELLKKTEQVRS